MGRCSHCGELGHTYRRCPQLTPEQRKEMFEKKKKEKEDKLQFQKALKEYEEQQQKKKEEEEKKKLELENQRVKYVIHNKNEYEIALYWGDTETDELNLFRNVAAFESQSFTCIKTIHRIVVIPVLEAYNTVSNNAEKTLFHKQGDESLFVLFDFYMCGYPDTEIEVKKEYTPPKSDLEMWKEFGLKSHYLLQEIYKMTGGGKSERYENIEPFLDLLQDIKIPDTCTEADKEQAGIPSALTNIT